MMNQFCSQSSSMADTKYVKKFIVHTTNRQYSFSTRFSPYQTLMLINKIVEAKYDCKIIAIDYYIKNTKDYINFNNEIKQINLEIDLNYNNVFAKQQENNLNQIFHNAIQLKPQLTDNNIIQEELQQIKKQNLKKQIQQIQKSLQIIISVYQKKQIKIKSFQSIQNETNKFKDQQINVNAYIRLNSSVQKKILERKEFLTANLEKGYYIHFFLNKTNIMDEQKQNCSQKPTNITNWSIGCEFQGETYNYFAIEKLNLAAQRLNKSVKIINFINVQYKNQKAQSIIIYSKLFNNIILKLTIRMQQIKYYRKWTNNNNNNNSNSNKKQNNKIIEYYFDLTYPPKYQIGIIDQYTASLEFYKIKWKRVQNFLFLRNKNIYYNQFLRLYLFNHSIVKITLNDDKYECYKVSDSIDQLQKFLSQIKNNENYFQCQNPIQFRCQIIQLNKKFAFGEFKDKLKINLQQNQNKIWKLKYFLLLMIRIDYLKPLQVMKVLNDVQNNIQFLDIYIFILWKISMNYNTNINNSKNALQEIQKSKQRISKNNLTSLIKKSFENTDLIVYIFRLHLTPSGYLYESPIPEMKGRLLRHYSKQSDYFLRINLTDDNGIVLKNQNYITRGKFRFMMNQIKLIDRSYIALGWSASQLRSYSLWYISEIETNQIIFTLQLILSFLGSFRNIKIPAKKAARIGQSFSASWNYSIQNVKEIQEKDIVSKNGFMFTDGIGKISANLIEKMSLKRNIKNCSVIQIRYKGIKGLLVQDQSLTQNTIIVRPSMIKYPCTHQASKKYFDILDWNKYKAGFLNRQIIILLKTLGIQDQIFMQLQQNHIKRIAQLTYKDCSIFKQLNNELNTQFNNLQPANKTILQLVKAGFLLQDEPFFKGMLQTMKKNGYFELKQKSRLHIPNSARIIGISDQYKILEQEQVYCQIQDQYSLNPKKQSIKGNVIVTRNPCLDPADIRKLKCIGKDQMLNRFKQKGYNENKFNKYLNCIIFPQKGQIPITAQISGSDLDGDCFFICWDPCLIPIRHQNAKMIDEPINKQNKQKKSKQQQSQVSYQQMLDFFIDYLNYEKLGQIDNSHLVHADKDLKNYALNLKCKELAKIHGKAVDYPKTGKCPPVSSQLLTTQFPNFMEKQNKKSYKSQSILGKLYIDIKNRIKDLIKIDNKIQNGCIDKHLIQLYIRQSYQPYTKQEIEQTIQILIQYQQKLSNIISLINVQTQYQIYSGNFSNVQNNVKIIGINRLISMILYLRSNFRELFFNNIQEQSKYNEIEKYDKIIFTHQTYRKAILYYLISYMYHFPSLIIQNQKFNSFQENAKKCLFITNTLKKSKYFGFVWFIIPKIIINMKNLAQQQENLKNEDQEQVI